MTNLPPELPGTETTWHYVQAGEKRGPVSELAIRDLLQKKAIHPDTLVWQAGMKDWLALRQSDLSHLVANQPPSLSPSTIGNGYVWTLAILPLVYGFFDASIATSNQKALAWHQIAGAPYRPTANLAWQIPILINALLGYMDNQRLKKAGYGTIWTRVFAVLATPIYLFVRAKKLSQTPWYAIVWIISFLISIFLVAAVTA